MKRNYKNSIIYLTAAIVFLIIFKVVLLMNTSEAETRDTLTRSELKDVKSALDLKAEYGDDVYPGFRDFHLPILSYNYGYEFLLNDTSLHNTFTLLDEENRITGTNIYRRKSRAPIAGAIKVGDSWVAAFPTRYTYNYEVSNIPGEKKADGNFMAPAIIGQGIKAYFASKNEERYLMAEDYRKAEAEYPYEDDEFKAMWNEEGRLLNFALRAKTKTETINYVMQFLYFRDNRRENSQLTADGLEFEKSMEWLEGVSYYGEMKAHLLQKENYYYKDALKKLKDNMGSYKGYERFKLSGMAQSLILDKLSDNWKEGLTEDGVYLEDLLRIYQ